MEDFIKDLMKQSPWAGVILAIIIIQQRYLKQRDDALEKRFKEFHDEHIYARTQTTEAVSRNTNMLETNVSATNHNSHAIELHSMALHGLTKAIDNLSRNGGKH